MKRCSDKEVHIIEASHTNIYDRRIENFSFMRTLISIDVILDYAGSQYLLQYVPEAFDGLPVVSRWGRESPTKDDTPLWFKRHRTGWQRMSCVPDPVASEWERLADFWKGKNLAEALGYHELSEAALKIKSHMESEDGQSEACQR